MHACTRIIESRRLFAAPITDANLARIYVNRGVEYEAKGQLTRAIADYTEAIELNPRHADAYNNRGVAYQNKGKRRKAIADYRKALQIDPSHRLAKRNLKALGVRP